jgi:PAS domain S-box-containing protein
MQNSEREVRSSDGRWYRARLLACRTLENDIDGVVIDFVDVTERKNAEELRREAAALRQHSRIMTLAPVFIRDMDSRITQWSADCERLFGYTSVEAIGRHADDLLSTQLPAPLELIYSELFSNGSWQGELIRTTSSGELVTVASRWIVYHNEAGDPAAILEANHDIGVRKRAEMELRETNRQKDEFLATLSHELRNPLSAILNGMQLLQSADEKKWCDPSRV